MSNAAILEDNSGALAVIDEGTTAATIADLIDCLVDWVVA
jgi:hypothetical protein